MGPVGPLGRSTVRRSFCPLSGLVSPGKGSLGLFGSPEELARVAFRPGRSGVISRSGGQTSTLAYDVCQSDLGIRTAVYLGSEQVLARP